jgi:hypothetical protein
MKKLISWILGPKKEEKYILNCIDENAGKKFSLLDLIYRLESRIEYLEKENISLINTLYEIENKLQSQIDSINPIQYNLKDYSLGE